MAVRWLPAAGQRSQRLRNFGRCAQLPRPHQPPAAAPELLPPQRHSHVEAGRQSRRLLRQTGRTQPVRSVLGACRQS
jgi:hypothetical protein